MVIILYLITRVSNIGRYILLNSISLLIIRG